MRSDAESTLVYENGIQILCNNSNWLKFSCLEEFLEVDNQQNGGPSNYLIENLQWDLEKKWETENSKLLSLQHDPWVIEQFLCAGFANSVRLFRQLKTEDKVNFSLCINSFIIWA
jgi:hypothetical protein